MKLMHNKYIVRDGEAVWTGSTNMTDDAFTLMENNIVTIASPAIAAYYTQDFEQLWQKGDHRKHGEHSHRSGHAQLFRHTRDCARDVLSRLRLRHRRRNAQKRAANAHSAASASGSLLLNSGTLINALTNVLRAGRVPVGGIYDRTQMADVYHQWQGVPSNRWKVPALQDIIARAKLAGKNSTPYSPTSHHDFMHNKILVIDDTVITGSYNFSRSAEFNAENILIIESAPLAECYCNYIDRLVQKYGAAPVAAPTP